VLAWLVSVIGGFIEALIALRFVLRLLGANPLNGFVQWVYDWSTPFVAPFAGIFGQSATVTGPGVVTRSVFDWTALIAFIVIGIIVALLVRLLSPRSVNRA
jgi:hypothetical protein